MEGNRKALYESAEKYMANSNDFLAAQNEAFKKDLAERQTKVEIVTGILNLGTKVRVTNFKAQAKNDMGLMLEAGILLDGLKEYTEKLRPITTSPEEMKRIEDTEAAAKKYARSMTDYINTSNQMVTEGQMMDAGASMYMKNCNDLLANQNAAMREEFDLGDVDLDERLGKVALVNEIIALGNAVQLMNFKAQATRDPKLIQEAAQRLKGVKEITAKLRKNTRKAEEHQADRKC